MRHLAYTVKYSVVDSSWNVMAHGDAGRGSEGETLANVVGSQYTSHYLRTRFIQHYYRWCAHLCCQQSTELTPPADLNGLVRFAERRYLVSARVPSHFRCSLPINSSPLTITVHSSVITTPVYNDAKYSVPFMTLEPSVFVYVYVYIYIYIYIYMYIWLHTCPHTHISSITRNTCSGSSKFLFAGSNITNTPFRGANLCVCVFIYIYI